MDPTNGYKRQQGKGKSETVAEGGLRRWLLGVGGWRLGTRVRVAWRLLARNLCSASLLFSLQRNRGGDTFFYRRRKGNPRFSPSWALCNWAFPILIKINFWAGLGCYNLHPEKKKCQPGFHKDILHLFCFMQYLFSLSSTYTYSLDDDPRVCAG